MTHKTSISAVVCLLLALAASTSASAKQQELMIDVGEVSLAATLLEPRGAKAAAVIIAGSGPTDRNGNSAVIPGNNNSLKYLAEALDKRKITTLRFDKRMIGDSADPALGEEDLRFGHLVSDAAGLADWLRERTGLPTLLIGHSEGGQIALTAADFMQQPPDGVVVLAGPGRHPAEILIDQLAAQLPPDLYERSETLIGELRNGNTVEDTPDVLASLFRPSVQPYMISWFANDPQAQAAAIEAPLLLVYGSSDLQVPPSEGATLRRVQSKAQLVVLDGMNHVLKRVGDDYDKQQASYGDPSLPIDKRLVRTISDFVGTIVE
ncbi:MAG: alpha/beta fold hydrolase [Pseudomonadota bacterium]